MRRDQANGRTGKFDVLGQLAVMRRYARSLTRDDSEAEDLVHDALLRAYERRGSFDAGRGEEGRGLRGWLLSVLHNVFVDRRRSRKAEARREAEALELAETVTAPAQEHQLRLAQVRDAFMELPEEQRAALHLVAIEGLGYAEAASTLDIPQGTLMSRLSRARATLRAIEDGTARPARLRIVGGSDDPAH
ncbi:RNA polymerase, sigma-24 subunit, ECF subfamily [Ancylobacter novellus DSM 506]|uniref:RNA polymerase, sigma-24 subunit, ECF subfamily n=1 Tax=Ancylobacter novellus (strain ATCC 8093 / DSM 506 / JCM 20403 / CCM 1077 / IAM 12100 / NBRC 12443 / NCIMB 10456) TaxID=639283 RepID=D6ZZQ0_ANCN5|nr:sigma-70 family RNA polymerase sigma factor [Ancylobacter novellus]ADH91245.1 RNA polymerase, sigma-24 subunit, ECF subfamily [Ancylobacter novellus DSM 506]